MPPSKIMLIRHGEKPPNPPNSDGPWDVAENGTSGKGHSLIVTGWQRAGALVAFFAPYNTAPTNKHIAKPGYIYAANPKGGSRRPSETVSPLAEWLNYPPKSTQFNLAYDISNDENT